MSSSRSHWIDAPAINTEPSKAYSGSPFALQAMVVGSLTACEMDRQQRHTATGAAIGGVAGGLLGGDIATTLGSAALGGVIGSQVNKGGDYDNREYRHHKKHKRHHHHRRHRDWDNDWDD